MLRIAMYLGLAVSVTLAFPATVWGQAPRGKRGGPAIETEIEEITVTAQKREENIQEVPISVTAITGAALAEKGTSSYVELGESVPNLRTAQANWGTSAVYLGMRGLSNQAPIFEQNPPVGLYLDGVYIAKLRGANMDLEDLERVEVLRGPQGTLYGRNTIAGTVGLVSRKPTEERSIIAATEVGNYDAFKARLTVNLPLIGKNGFFQSDALGTLSLRENAMYRVRDGFIQNSLPAPNNAGPTAPAPGTSAFSNLNRIFSMTSLRWQPRNDITIDYEFEYHRHHNATTPGIYTMIYKGGPLDGGRFDLNPLVRKNRVDAYFARGILTSDLKRIDQPVDDGNHRMQILTGTWDVGELGPLGAVTLKSISGYRSYTSDENLTGPNPGGSHNHGNLSTWSEELQWIGTAPRVRYVLGAFYYGEHATEPFGSISFGGAANTLGRNTSKNSSYAAFGQLTWTPPILSDKLSVTGGLRYTEDHLHHDRVYTDFNVPKRNFHASIGRQFRGSDMLTPMGDISYQWTDSLMTYFRVSKGYQSGVANGFTTDIRAYHFTDPEKLVAYEAGFKSQWFENRLRLNADGFFSDYTDQVRNVIRPSLTGGGSVFDVENVGKSEIWGSEVEVVAVPLRGLEASASYGFTSTKIIEWISPKYDQNGNPVFDQNNQPVLENVADKYNPNIVVPEHAATLGLTYTLPPTTMGTFSAHIEVYWQDQIRWDNPRGPHPDTGWNYEVVHGRLQFVNIPLQKGTLDLAAFARNLFDRKYRVFGGDSPGSSATNVYGDPRTFGLGLTYHFTDS